jgi:hypothetical protein
VALAQDKAAETQVLTEIYDTWQQRVTPVEKASSMMMVAKMRIATLNDIMAQFA